MEAPFVSTKGIRAAIQSSPSAPRLPDRVIPVVVLQAVNSSPASDDESSSSATAHLAVRMLR